MTRHDPIEPRDAGDYEEHPVGSLFIVMLFLIVLAGMWGAVYFIYLSR